MKAVDIMDFNAITVLALMAKQATRWITQNMTPWPAYLLLS